MCRCDYVLLRMRLLYKTWSGSFETSEQAGTLCFNPVSIPLAAEVGHGFSILYKSVFLMASKVFIFSQNTI